MVDDLRKLCLSKDDFNVLNTIGRGHFGQVPCNKGLSKLLARQTLSNVKSLPYFLTFWVILMYN